MTRQAFLRKKFHAATLAVIEHANEIIAEYERGGFSLTLRQLYYQFVARRLIENTVSEYKRLGKIVNDGRLAGMIDWDGIEDRTRRLESYQSYLGPWEAVEMVAQSYCEDPWLSQNCRPEVWIEKDALIGVIESVCSDYHLPHFACRGNVSQSELYAAGKRFASYIADGLTPVVLHLGDHDPNGLDMTRDNRDRLRLFAGYDIEVRRLALKSRSGGAICFAAKSREGNRHPVFGLRRRFWHPRMLGTRRARAERDRRSNPRRDTRPDRQAEVAEG